MIEIYLQSNSGKKTGPFPLDDERLIDLIKPNSLVFPTHEGRWMKANEVEALKVLFSGEDDQNPEFVNKTKKVPLTAIAGANLIRKESTSSVFVEGS